MRKVNGYEISIFYERRLHMENILDLEVVFYDDLPVESGCVTGGGGCSCDDGTSE